MEILSFDKVFEILQSPTRGSTVILRTPENRERQY